jgi:hypothetical protein
LPQAATIVIAIAKRERNEWQPTQVDEPRAHQPIMRALGKFFSSKRLAIVIIYLSATLAGSATAGTPPSAAPVSRTDIQKITQVIGAVTNKPILMIAGVPEDRYVQGAVRENAYELNAITGKRTPQYIRTDIVSVYMPYTDRSHVEVYIVRKLRGRWKIEAKKDWFL